ncbi:hypothetical protein EK904_014443 [Melospiza melodia maxima]|nr:hypothetical protein EK904_014443 [Melospiza melodia maxima]
MGRAPALHSSEEWRKNKLNKGRSWSQTLVNSSSNVQDEPLENFPAECWADILVRRLGLYLGSPSPKGINTSLRGGSASHQVESVSPASASQLEVSLVHPDLPRLSCDVSPLYLDLPSIRSSPQEGLYHVEVIFQGHVINNLTEVEKENYSFKFLTEQTPVVYQIHPSSGTPGNLIQIHGKTIAGRYETLDFNVDYIDGEELSPGQLFLPQKEMDGPVSALLLTGELEPRSHNVSFSVFNKGKSAVHKGAWLISAKQELFLYQTHPEIFSVFPVRGSLAGGTELIITGDFFEEPVQVTVAGNRGLLFEVWDDASDLTEAGPGYRWQFVPNASSPVRFLSGAKESFRYSVILKREEAMAITFSSVRYYLEALHHAKTPSKGMRVGVQIHNTWLDPHVVNSYYTERHEIRARALHLPELQMLTVSGTGYFSISWNNTLKMIPTNATAQQVQAAIEELLSVGCETEPTSAKILFHCGFEKEDMKNIITTGHIVSGTEPFCGRFSIHRPSQLVKTSPSTLPRYDLTKYPHDLPVNSPVFVHQINVQSPVLQKETPGSFYLDELIVADRAVIGYSVKSIRDPKPQWPEERIIEAVSVVGSPPSYNVSWEVSGCGSSLPLLSPRGAVLGEGSKEYGHLNVSTEDVRVSLTIQRLQKSSPPLGGTFHIHLANTVIPGVSVHISAHQLHRLLQDNVDNFTAPFFNTSDFTVARDSSSCYESVWTLTWEKTAGDLPNVSAENLTGLKPTVSTRVVYDGGVFIGPIFGDMLATPHNQTQVVVMVNDVLANCSGSCSFQFSQELTPIVRDVEYSSGEGSQATVVLRAAGFGEEQLALQVEVDRRSCHISSLNQTHVVCKVPRLPVGTYPVTLLVAPHGFALGATTGQGIFLTVQPTLGAVEPPSTSEIVSLNRIKAQTPA